LPAARLPTGIGIINSPPRVIRDFLNVAGAGTCAARSALSFRSAGRDGALEIVAGIAFFNRARTVDVIVVARGGGSLDRPGTVQIANCWLGHCQV